MKKRERFLDSYLFFRGAKNIRATMTHFPSGQTWTGVWANTVKEEEACFALVYAADQYARSNTHNFQMVSDKGRWLVFPAAIVNECIFTIECDRVGEADGD